MNTNYVDVPMVEITATGGCGYVNVSWTVIGNNEACMVRSYTVTLLSFAMEELDKILTASTQRIFRNLLYDTVFYVTVFGNTIVAPSNSATASVRTLDLKGINRYSYIIAMYVLYV